MSLAAIARFGGFMFAGAFFHGIETDRGSLGLQLPVMPIAFQDVIDAYYQNLYRFALSLSKSPDMAWDLTQETFLIWARKGSTIRSVKATKSWLYTTLYREYLKLAKRGSRMVAFEDPNLDVDVFASNEGELPHFDSENVMELLMELKSEYRKVVSLYYLESYTYKEISKILDVPIGTVMSRLARGKEALRGKLMGEAGENKVVPYKRMGKFSENG